MSKMRGGIAALMLAAALMMALTLLPALGCAEEGTQRTAIVSGPLETKELHYVSFRAEGEKVKGLFVTDGSAPGTLPEAPEREGKRFDGWYAEGTQLTAETVITADTAAEAVYRERMAPITSTQGSNLVPGEWITLTVDLTDFADCEEVNVIWEIDGGNGWEEAGRGDSFEYEASIESLRWDIRARIQYR